MTKKSKARMCVYLNQEEMIHTRLACEIMIEDTDPDGKTGRAYSRLDKSIFKQFSLAMAREEKKCIKQEDLDCIRSKLKIKI